MVAAKQQPSQGVGVIGQRRVAGTQRFGRCRRRRSQRTLTARRMPVATIEGSPLISIAQGDTNGDGIEDMVIGAGPGSAPMVQVIDGATGSLRLDLLAFDATVRSGVEVAVGDMTGDGLADIVAVSGPGTAPVVRLFHGTSGALIRAFSAMPPDFAGGLHVAAGDVNSDGYADIIVGVGPSNTPLVQVFDGLTADVIRQFLAYTPAFVGGVYVAAGDVNGDGIADIITGAGAGGGPHVKVFDGVTNDLTSTFGSFFAYGPEFSGGARVAAGDLNGDGRAEIITGAGPGGGPHVRVFDAAGGTEIYGLYAFEESFGGGVFVAGPSPLRRMAVDAPAQNAEVQGNGFAVTGWALGDSVRGGTGVDAVHVWAYPAAGGAPILVGVATHGDSRPDVAAAFGGEFTRSGFHLTGTLPPGAYHLVVFARNGTTHMFDNRQVVGIVVR